MYFKSKGTRKLLRVNYSPRMQIHRMKYRWRTARYTFRVESVIFPATNKGFTCLFRQLNSL
jgi:hypothetical protein